MKKLVLFIVIAAIGFFLLWSLRCCNTETVITKTDTVTVIKEKWDTFTEKEVVYKPKWKPVYLHDTIVDSIPVYVDRLVVLTQDSMVVKNDSTDIKVTYSIYSENPLLKLEKVLSYKVRYKEIERTVTQEVARKHALFVGPALGLISNSSFVGLNTLYENKGQKLYKLGLGVTTQFKPVINAGMYWQILK